MVEGEAELQQEPALDDPAGEPGVARVAADGPEQDLVPFTPDQTREWLEKHRSHDVDLFESLFGKLPEAGSGESKFTLRLPDSLRERLAARAKDNGQSLNAWIIKCLERCAPPGEEPAQTKKKSRA